VTVHKNMQPGVMAAALVLSALAGCATDIEVGQISSAWPNYPANAVPYALPQKTFTIATSTTVTGCKEDADGEVIHGRTTVVLGYDVEADPEQRYYIYFDSGSRSKNLDYSVQTYPGGALKSVSASIRDQVAPMTAAVSGALIKSVLSMAAVPLASAPPVPLRGSNCASLNAAIAKSKADQKAQDDRLTLTQTDRWAPSQENLSTPIKVGLAPLQAAYGLINPRWFREPNAEVSIKVLDGQATGVGPDGIEAMKSKAACREPQAAAQAPEEVSEGPYRVTMSPDACTPPLVPGLVFRNGVRASVEVWTCNALCDAAQAPASLAVQNTSVETIPQLGRRFLVPVHSGYAQDAAAYVEMDADGMISKIELTSVSSLGDSVAALGNNVSSLGSAITSAESTTNRNQNLANCLEAQKAVTSNGGTPIGICH